MKAALKWLQQALSKVPVYGELAYSPKESITSALKDIFFASLFSLLPLWFYPLILALGEVPFWTSLKSFVLRGELFLYSAALLGPLVYSITKTYADPSDEVRKGTIAKIRSIQFPYGTWFVTISILVCTFAAGLFGVVRAGAAGFTGLNIPPDRTLLASSMLYLFTLSCMFCVSVYRVNLENVSTRFTTDERELMDEWQDRS